MADVSLSSAEISDIAQVYMSNTIRLMRLNNHIFDVRVYALILSSLTSEFGNVHQAASQSLVHQVTSNIQ